LCAFFNHLLETFQTKEELDKLIAKVRDNPAPDNAPKPPNTDDQEGEK